jgi:hypothetical protein
VYYFSEYMLPSVAGPYYVDHTFIGLGPRVQLSEIHFGVPIHLLNGTLELIPSGFPSAVPAVLLSITITYVFPVTDDQGTWNMYPAGGGGAFPLGGFVFEQTSTA